VDKSNGVKSRDIFSRYLLMKRLRKNILQLFLALCKQATLLFNFFFAFIFEFCSSPCTFCSRPAAVSNIPLRKLTNASVNVCVS